MKAALIQYSPIWEEPEKNIIKLNEILEKQLTDEDLIIFPEMTLTGFTMSSKKFGEEWDGIGTKYFINIADKFKKHVFAGIIEKDNGQIYNSLFHIDNNGIIAARYRKIHPFTYSEEDKHYNAGKEVVLTKIGQIKIGLTICYDLRFPELYRKYAKDEAEIIINIANWPVQRIEHYKVLLRAHAVINQCYVIGVNRVGDDPYHKYPGWSAVFNPMGEKIVLVANEEKLISAPLEIEKVKQTREKLPFLKDIKLI